MAKRPTRLMIADSEHSADMLYATGMFVPDPFLWCEIDGEPMVIVSPLEYGRAKRCIRSGTKVYALDDAMKQFGIESRKLADQAIGLSRHFKIDHWEVPYSFCFGLSEALLEAGIHCHSVEDFFPGRQVKSPAEVELVREGQQLAEAGMERALSLLREATIVAGQVILAGRPLTAEFLRGEIDATITRLGGNAQHTIVAPGPEGADPHNAGYGPILANQPLIIDIFPRVAATGYFGDLTRTVVKGRAPELVQRAFDAVLDARDFAKTLIRDGVNGKDVHEAVTERLRSHDFNTDSTADPPYGFFHGTGHGLGLQIHEAPRISSVDCTLRTGHVVTVEPGLYYPQWGGVRLEDVVVVEDDCCTTLTSIPTYLEID